MFRLPRFCGRAFLALALLSAPGCERLFDKGAKDEIATAEKKAKAGDFRGAVQFYEASLDGTAKSADTHYELGLLYADKLHSPLDSIHHLNRYLALAPGGAHAKDAERVKKDDEDMLRKKLSNGAPVTQGEAVRLQNLNQKLLKENAELQSTIAALKLQKAPSATTVKGKGEPGKKPIPAGARTYTVKSGDTLAKIARQFYKNSTRAKDIQDANFEQLSGTVRIKPGMVLTIPK